MTCYSSTLPLKLPPFHCTVVVCPHQPTAGRYLHIPTSKFQNSWAGGRVATAVDSPRAMIFTCQRGRAGCRCTSLSDEVRPTDVIVCRESPQLPAQRVANVVVAVRHPLPPAYHPLRSLPSHQPTRPLVTPSAALSRGRISATIWAHKKPCRVVSSRCTPLSAARLRRCASALLQ